MPTEETVTTVHSTPAYVAPTPAAVAPAVHPAPVVPGATEPVLKPRVVPYVPLTAKFVVQEITQTVRGVTVLTLSAQYDSNTKKDNSLIKGSIPKGNLTIEVDNNWAAQNVQHGTVFMLSSVNPR